MGFEVHDSWLTTSIGHGERMPNTGRDESQAHEGRRVVFDVESSDSEDRQTLSDRKSAKFVREFNFDPEYVCALSPLYCFKGSKHMTQYAVVRTTPVDLHSRNDQVDAERAIVNEARALFKCRHPNVLLMLGICLYHRGGPALIMERAWVRSDLKK